MEHRQLAASWRFGLILSVVLAYLAAVTLLVLPVQAQENPRYFKPGEIKANVVGDGANYRQLKLQLRGEMGSLLTVGKEVIDREESGKILQILADQTKIGNSHEDAENIRVEFKNNPSGGQIVIDGRNKSYPAGETLSIVFEVEPSASLGRYSFSTDLDQDQATIDPGNEENSVEKSSEQRTSESTKLTPLEQPVSSSATPTAQSSEVSTTKDEKEKPESIATKEKDPGNRGINKDQPKDNVSPSVRELNEERAKMSFRAAPDSKQYGDFRARIISWSEGNYKPLVQDEWDRTLRFVVEDRGTLRTIKFTGKNNFSQSKVYYSVTINGKLVDFNIKDISLLGDRTHPTIALTYPINIVPGDEITVKYRQDGENGWASNSLELKGLRNPINDALDPLPPLSCEQGQRVWIAQSAGQAERNSVVLSQARFDINNFREISSTAGPDGFGWVYNALGYNPRDRWLYAVSQDVRDQSGQLVEDFPPGHLLQIHPETGKVHDRGEITGFKTNGDREKISTGFFGNNGTYYIANGSQSGTATLYSVNFNTLMATPLGSSDQQIKANDHAPLSTDATYAWGIRSSSPTSTTPMYMERVNLLNGKVDLFDITNLRLPRTVWGSAWRNSNGTISFSGNNGEGVYQFEITNPYSQRPEFKIKTVSKIPVSYNNDGASNGAEPYAADLSVQKKFTGFGDDGRARWKITLKNDGSCGSSGSTVTDTFPARYSGMKVEDQGGASSVTLDEKKHQIKINFNELEPGVSRDIIVSANVGDKNQCIDNGVKVVGVEDDPNSNNNTASVSGCTVNVIKTVQETTEKWSTTENRRLYTAHYTVEVKNNDPKNSQKFGPMTDKLGYPAGVKPTSVRATDENGVTKNLKLDSNSFVIAEQDTIIGPGKISRFSIEVDYVFDASEFKPETKDCNGTQGFGLYNKVSLPSGQEVEFSDNSACTPVLLPQNPQVIIRKADANNGNRLLTGSEFTLHQLTRSGDDARDPWYFSGENLSEFILNDVPYGDYMLVEEKAPHNYFLLSEPYRFALVPGENGAVVIPKDSNSSGLIASESDSQRNAVIITVADLTVAELPLTGGRGYLYFLTFGSLIVVCGIGMARNRIRE
ncbi:hypothetical protein GSS88_07235 [Corynebacterium sp. 3HC-13]|uniref:DUF6923 family protein n=1 Tax=Corynebacterium poyangense TaxID=2684405 RepID=UPI001CCCAC01|nr:SpaA isopeptide-forming pilin-related protein [Corynebacterium poyangense]MBZ8177583.1 hypothetical protein [Corynebacterium poyangense]